MGPDCFLVTRRMLRLGVTPETWAVWAEALMRLQSWAIRITNLGALEAEAGQKEVKRARAAAC